jgi:Concanavalin A-like lectin/glucanases superfamily
MKMNNKIQFTSRGPSALGIVSSASVVSTARPSRGRFAERIGCTLLGAFLLLLAALPAWSSTLTYNFNDGTLQGWHNRVWDLSAAGGSGGWVDLDPNVQAMPVTINGGVIQPASGDDNLFGNNGTQVDPVGGQTDNHLNTLWLRSRQFTLDASGDLTVQMARGNANGPAPANDTSVSHIAADASALTGWKGVALRRVSDGAFVLNKPRTDQGDTMITVTFTAAELAPFVGVKCTLDLINSENGGWGWLSMDNVSIPGLGTDVLLEKADPLIVVGVNTTVLVSIPDGSNATATVTVYVTNSNPSALTINGSAASVVPVVFTAGGAFSQEVPLVGTSVGDVQLTAGSAGLGSGSLALTVYPKLLGRWISGAANLSETSGFRPAGTHDGVAVGTAAALAYSSDVPPGCTGQSLDLRAGDVGVMVTNSATTDGGYMNTYDDVIRRKFTIAFWAKGFPGTWNGWVSKRGEDNIGWQLRRMGGDPVAGFTLRGLDNSDGTGSTINVNDTSWHHFVGVWDQPTGTRTLYVDGVFSHVVNNAVGQMMNLAAGKHLTLGTREQGGTGFESYFAGLLFDVRMYSYPLSESEVHGLIPAAVKLTTGRPAVPVAGTTPLTVSIPAWANASVPVTVYVTNGNPSRLDIDGSTAPVTTLTFAAGGAASQALTLKGLSVGQDSLSAGATGMASASAGVTVYPATTTPGLIGHWVAGAPHLADISGFTPDGAHDGSFVGVPPAGNFSSDLPFGRPGQSLDLRGAGNIAVQINNTRTADAGYLNTFDDGISGSQFSVAFWAKGFPDTWNPWVSKYGENGRGWQLRRNGGNPVACFTVRGQANEDGNGSTISVNDNNWHHFLGVWDGVNGNRSLYVDGVLSPTITGQSVPMSAAPAAHMALGVRGYEDGGLGNWFKGLLYDVRMYNTALTASDAVELVGAVLASPPSLSLVSPSPNTNLITIVVPTSVVATSTVSVVVTSDKPAVAVPVGAVGGVLTITLPMGGANSASFAVQANGAGTAHFTYACALLPAATSTTIAVQQPNINGLVAYWNFDNQTLAETSGFQTAGTHDGVAVGTVAYVPGRLGGYAADLRAANTAVRIKNSTVSDPEYRTTFDAFLFGSSAGFSWSCWVKGLPTSDWASWIAKDGETAGYAIRKAGGSDLTFTLRNSAGDPDDPTATAARITDNLWHHLAAVYDPVALQRRLYLDGAECISITDSNLTVPPVNSPLFFGARDSTGDTRFARVIVDEIRAYDKALTLGEITSQVGSPLISLTPGKWAPNVGDPDLTATITVPASMVATSAVNVTLTSANPAVAIPVGAVGGSLTVNFPMGGANTASVAVHAVGIGATTITGTSPSSVINGEIVVTTTVTPVLLGHWLSGAGDLVERSGYRPAGTHDGVAVGANAGSLGYSSTDLPSNFTGQSLDLNAGSVGVMIAKSATGDAGYQPTFDSDIATNFTVAFWAKGMPGEWGGWVTKDGEGAGWQLRRMGTDNIAGFTMRGIGGDPDGGGSGINVNNGNWHHYVGIWDQAAGTRTLYVDGVFSHVVYTTPNQAMTPSLAHLVFGGLQDESGNYWDNRWVSCLLFDVRIYKNAISEFKIQGLLTAPSLQPPLTIQRWTGNQIRISWPTSFADFGIEQSSAVSGGWGPSGLSVTVEGSENAAYAPTTTSPQFFRLKK